MCFVCRQPGGGKLQGSGRVDESSVRDGWGWGWHWDWWITCEMKTNEKAKKGGKGDKITQMRVLKGKEKTGWVRGVAGWICETSAEAWRGASSISHLTQPSAEKPNSNEKHKHLQCSIFPGLLLPGVASAACTYSKSTHSVLWKNVCGRDWLTRTFTTVENYTGDQSSCVLGCVLMTVCHPLLGGLRSWSLSCRCKVSWQASPLRVATYGSSHVHLCRHTYTLLHPAKQTKAFDWLKFSFTPT